MGVVGMTMTMLEWMGGSHQQNDLASATYTSGSPYLLTTYAWNYKRIWRFNPTGGSAYIKLPAATTMPTGAGLMFFENLAANTNAVNIQANDGTLIGILKPQDTAANNKCDGLILDNSTAAVVWGILGLLKTGLVKLPLV